VYTSTMPYFNFHEQRLFYAHHNAGEKRPSLLLIHGAGGNRTHWPKAMRPVANYETFVLDLPGHGRSDPPGCHTVDDFANAVAAFVQSFEKPIVVVGHSMGGGIAQTIGLKQLPNVIGLVLIGTSARLPVGKAILDNALENPSAAIDFIARYAWSASAPDEMIEMTRKVLTEVPPSILHNDFSACNQFNLTGQLGSINIPTLVISGSEDKMTLAKYGRFLANEIPNAQYHCLAGVGHYIMLEKPAEVAALVEKFLEAISP
jgi:pimeloyl-ACP methyl ester carboxylesterase